MKKRRKASKKILKKPAHRPAKRILHSSKKKASRRPAKKTKVAKSRSRRAVRAPAVIKKNKKRITARVRVIGPTTAGFSLLSGNIPSRPAVPATPRETPSKFDPAPTVQALLGEIPPRRDTSLPGSLPIEAVTQEYFSPHILRLAQAASPAVPAASGPVRSVPLSGAVGGTRRLNPDEVPNFVIRPRNPVAATADFLLRLPVAAVEGYLAAVDGGARLVTGAGRLPFEGLRRISPWRDNEEDLGAVTGVIAAEVSTAPARVEYDMSAASGSREGWLRTMAPFVIMAVIVSLPLHAFSAVAAIRAGKASIINSSRQASNHVRQAAVAAASSQLETAEQEFQNSQTALRQAREELDRLPAVARELARVLPRNGKALRAGETLLASGEALSEAAASLTSEIRRLGDDTNVIYKLTVVRNAADASIPPITAAAEALRSVDPKAVPGSETETLVALKNGVAAAESGLRELVSLSETVMNLLGRDNPRRYLVVFQNSNELRPTGGFMGSFAELTVFRGSIDRLVVPPGGSYDIQGQLKALVLPPEPLRLVTGRWFFHDANWFPDWPTSAAKIQWFYEKSGGPSTDGVIAVNSSLLPDLLRIIGPVTIPGGRTFTAENVLAAVQDEVESPEARASGRPKTVIGELSSIIMERLAALPADRFLAAAGVLGEALASKRLMIYSKDSDIESVIARHRWDGGMPATDGDFVGLVTANIGGEKTDAVIDETVEHESVISADGAITDTVTIRRTHTGLAGVPGTGARNYSYLRLYVPEGSVLSDVSGDFGGPAPEDFEGADPVFEQDKTLAAAETEKGIEPGSGTRVTTEFGKTAFGNWMKLDPGETRAIRYTYRLPFRAALPEPPKDAAESLRQIFHGPAAVGNRLFVWHQPGAERRRVSSVLRLPAAYRVAWQTPTERNAEQAVLLPETRDMFIGAVITRR